MVRGICDRRSWAEVGPFTRAGGRAPTEDGIAPAGGRAGDHGGRNRPGGRAGGRVEDATTDGSPGGVGGCFVGTPTNYRQPQELRCLAPPGFRSGLPELMERCPAPPAASPEVPYPTGSRWMSDWLPSPLVPPEKTQILWGHNIHFRGWGIRGGPGGKRGREPKVGRALRAAAGGAALWF